FHGQGPLPRVEVARERSSVHHLIYERAWAEGNAGVNCRAEQRGREAFRGRPRVVRLVAVLAVKVLLEHQLPVPGDEHAVRLERADAIDRSVDDRTDEGLEGCP